MIVAQHYMHQAKMKRQGLIKNKVVGMTCDHKCGEGIVNPTCPCDSATFGG
jgi:hypothetical protein